MTLFFKEVTTPNKIVDAIQRFNLVPNKSNIVMPENNERAILLWVNNTIEALKNRLLSSKMVSITLYNYKIFCLNVICNPRRIHLYSTLLL